MVGTLAGLFPEYQQTHRVPSQAAQSKPNKVVKYRQICQQLRATSDASAVLTGKPNDVTHHTQCSSNVCTRESNHGMHICRTARCAHEHAVAGCGTGLRGHYTVVAFDRCNACNMEQSSTGKFLCLTPAMLLHVTAFCCTFHSADPERGCQLGPVIGICNIAAAVAQSAIRPCSV